MNLLVTGGTGFIGSRFALDALARGDRVRVLALEKTSAEADNRAALDRAGAEIVLGSVTAPDVVRDAVRDVEVVVHLAAAQHEMNVPDEHFRSVNVEGTRTVLEASAEAGVRTVVHGSTIGVYGRPVAPVDEDTPPDPDNIYGVTKLEGERLALSYNERVPVAVVRISEAYGPGDRRLLKLFRAIDKGRFFRIGAGGNRHSTIFVDDLVRGLRLAAERPGAVGEVTLLAPGEPVTTDRMIDAVASALGKDPPRLRAPLAPFVLAATAMELTLRPLGIQPPLHRRRLDFFRKSFTIDPSRARERLGFSAETSFEEGARLTAAWYRDEGLL